MSLPTLRLPKRVYPRVPKCLPMLEQYPLYSLGFDGDDDLVTVPHSPSIAPTSVTVETWVKPNAGYGETAPRLVQKQAGGVGGGGYMVLIISASGLLQFSWWSAAGVLDFFFSIATVPVGGWTPVTCTYDFPNAQIFFNGLLDNSYVTLVPMGTTIVNLWIGNRDTLDRTLNGLTTGTRIYNRALSPAEIHHNIRNPLNPVRAGLVLFLPMIEGQGIGVADYSGQGNNGTLLNAVSWRDLMKYEIPATIGW